MAIPFRNTPWTRRYNAMIRFRLELSFCTIPPLNILNIIVASKNQVPICMFLELRYTILLVNHSSNLFVNTQPTSPRSTNAAFFNRSRCDQNGCYTIPEVLQSLWRRTPRSRFGTPKSRALGLAQKSGINRNRDMKIVLGMPNFWTNPFPWWNHYSNHWFWRVCHAYWRVKITSSIRALKDGDTRIHSCCHGNFMDGMGISSQL